MTGLENSLVIGGSPVWGTWGDGQRVTRPGLSILPPTEPSRALEPSQQGMLPALHAQELEAGIAVGQAQDDPAAVRDETAVGEVRA